MASTERALEPDSLLYYSFRHSQGFRPLQTAIFQYMDVRYGLQVPEKPEDVSPWVYEKMGGLLSHGFRSNGASHANVLGNPHQGQPTDQIIRSEVDGTLLRYLFNPASDLSPTEREALPTTLAEKMVDCELQFVGLRESRNPVEETPDWKRDSRARRAVQRAAVGRLSFLHYYGRDGHSTGFHEFSAMYAEAYDQYQSPALEALRNEHEAGIASTLHALGQAGA